MLRNIIEKINERKSFTREENDYLYNLLQKADTNEERKEIKELIVQGNIGLAVRELQKMTYPNYLKEDLLQEAIIALMEAVDSFDPKKKYSFSTYAAKAMRNHLNDCWQIYANSIYIPPHVYRNAIKKGKKKQYDEMVERLKPSSIEEVSSTDIASDYPVDESLIREEEIISLNRALKRLPAQDRQLLFDRYLKDDLTYQNIADKHKKSLSYVYRRMKEIINILQEWMEEEDHD